MKATIYGSTYERAFDKFEEIIEDYKSMRINPIRIVRSKSHAWVEFENGDCWRAARVSENCRGNRNNIAYVDHLISQEAVDTIIKPQLTLRPFTAIHYY